MTKLSSRPPSSSATKRTSSSEFASPHPLLSSLRPAAGRERGSRRQRPAIRLLLLLLYSVRDRSYVVRSLLSPPAPVVQSLVRHAVQETTLTKVEGELSGC